MWLPKDERKVLNHYYKKLHGSGVGTRGQIFLTELETRLSGKDKRIRIKRASKTLEKRDLLAFLNFQGDAVTVQLSLQGYDLGRKYNSWWTRSGLWFAEYKKPLDMDHCQFLRRRDWSTVDQLAVGKRGDQMK